MDINMNEIYEWIRNIVIYLILNTIIMNLLGNSSYKKYISIVSGMILLLIVVSPFLKLLNMDEILDYYLNSNIYQADVSDFQNELKLMEDKQKDVVFAGFEDKIRAQLADMLEDEGLYLYEVEVVINQDSGETDSFGEIKSLSISAGYLEDVGIPVNMIDIERIVISDINKKDKSLKENIENLLSPTEIQIKKRLSDFYNMKQDNINISIKEGKR
ncbi:MAG: stage III sporulation protein AF [Clostridiales bacterium]|nr:stage III sporulation protein AF [Clostridiales bacterium]